MVKKKWGKKLEQKKQKTVTSYQLPFTVTVTLTINHK